MPEGSPTLCNSADSWRSGELGTPKDGLSVSCCQALSKNVTILVSQSYLLVKLSEISIGKQIEENAKKSFDKTFVFFAKGKTEHNSTH